MNEDHVEIWTGNWSGLNRAALCCLFSAFSERHFTYKGASCMLEFLMIKFESPHLFAFFLVRNRIARNRINIAKSDDL
jgi:hypothetical protein